MNAMAGNILDIEHADKRVKMEASFEHYIFTWNISNISFCFSGSDFRLSSSNFLLADGSNWQLELHVNSSEEKYNIYTYLCQLEPGNESKKVKFNLTLQKSNAFHWSVKNQPFFVTQNKSVSGGFLEVNKHFLHNILFGIRTDDILTVTCEMMIVYVKEILRNDINFYTDFEDLSGDIMKLLQTELCPNIDLVVRGDDYTNIYVHIKAHKEILSSWSSKFARLIGPDTRSLKMWNYTYDVVKAMLVFLYSGDISKLAANDPPSPELWKCAQEYGIAELSKHLRPKELVTNTSIELKSDEHSCNLQNFPTLWTAGNKIEESVVLRHLGDVQVKMEVSFAENAPLFRIEVTNAMHLGVILIEIFLGPLNISQPVWQIRQVDNSGNCTFEVLFNPFFIHENIRPPHDTLSIRCIFRSALRNVTSRNDAPMLLSENVVSKGFDENALPKKMGKLLSTHWHSDTKIGAVDDDNYIGVHWSVLNARCPLFVKDLKNRTKAKSRLELLCSPQSVKCLLHYLYTGTLEVWWSVRTLIDLHHIGLEYGILHLSENCVRMLRTRVTRYTACRICSFADAYEYEELKSMCFQCIFLHEHEILNSNNWSRWISKNKSLEREIEQYISNRRRTVFYGL